MTERKIQLKGDLSAFLSQFLQYAEPIEKGLSEMDRKRYPVRFALESAYIARLRIARDTAESGIDEQVGREIQELSPWILPKSPASTELDLHSELPLGQDLMRAGCDYRDVHEAIEEARKPKKGRPPADPYLAIEALEMRLAGKTYNEIQNSLLEKSDGTAFSPKSANRRDRIRKLIKTVKPIYDKYRPRK